MTAEDGPQLESGGSIPENYIMAHDTVQRIRVRVLYLNMYLRILKPGKAYFVSEFIAFVLNI